MVLLVVLASLVGCSLAEFASGDFSNQPDGSHPSGDGGPSVRDNDANPGSAPEGGVSFCAGQHLFCDDFERGLNLDDGAQSWTGKNLTAGLTLDWSDARAKAGAHSIRVTSPAKTSGDKYALLTKQFIAPWRGIRIQYDVYWVKPVWQSGNVSFGNVSYQPQTTTDAVGTFVFLSSNGLQGTVHRPSYMPISTTAPINDDRWNRIVVTFDPVTKPGRIQMTVDGISFANAAFDLDNGVSTTPAGPAVTVSVGLYEPNDPIPPFEAYFDNVVIDWL